MHSSLLLLLLLLLVIFITTAAPIDGDEVGQLFFLATPSTASSAVDRAFEAVFKPPRHGPLASVGEAWPGLETACAEGGKAMVFTAAPHALSSSSSTTTTTTTTRPTCSRDAVSRELNITYRGKTHMDLRFDIKTRAENLQEKEKEQLRKVAEQRPRAFLRAPFLLVDSLDTQPVLIMTTLRRPEAWIRSVARRFHGVKLLKGAEHDANDRTVGAWVEEEAHFLWNTQTRMLAGNFTQFGTEVIGGGKLSQPVAYRPTRAAAEAWASIGGGTEALLGKALRALREDIVWFGLVERLEDSMRVAAHRFCWRWDRTAMARRIQRKSSPKAEVASSLSGVMSKRFALDLELYDAADHLLSARLERAAVDSRRGVSCAVSGCDVKCVEIKHRNKKEHSSAGGAGLSGELR